MSSRRVVKKKTSSGDAKKAVKKGKKIKVESKDDESVEEIETGVPAVSPNLPISDDTLDFLDAQVDEFNDTDNLSKKIAIHRQLEEVTKGLVQEIDGMVEIIDQVDQAFLNSELVDVDDQSESTDVNDDIVKLEKMVEGMKEADVMQVKIEHYKRITEAVKRCRAKCTADTMSVAKCN